jgi:PGF-pre-PGF domain-containing protein
VCGGIGVAGAIDVTAPTNITFPGTYVLRTNIFNTTAGTCINISSSNVIFDGSGYTIDGRDTANSIGIYVYNATVPLVNVTIRNVTLNDWYHGVYFRNVHGGIADNLTATSNTGQGVQVSASTGCTLANLTLRGNRYGVNLTGGSEHVLDVVAANGSTYGIILSLSDRNTVTRSNVSSNTNSGMYLTQSHGNTMTGTVATGNTNNGISLATSHNNTIAGGTMQANPYGMNILSCMNTTISGNIADMNSNTGIYLVSSGSGSITANSASRNTNNGIYLSGSSNNTVSGNAANSNQYGIRLASSSDCVLSANAANSNSNSGFYVTSSYNTTLSQNTAQSNQYGFSLTTAGNTTLSANSASANTNTGITLTTAHNSSLVSNTANSNPNIGILLTTSNNCTLAENTANGNTNYGVRLTTSHGGNITSTTATGNTYGLYLATSHRNALVGNTANSNTNSGIYLATASNNTLTANIANSNANVGIYLATATNTTLSGGYAHGNSYAGIYLATSSNNTITAASACDNAYGLYFTTSSNNTISGVTGDRNLNTAIYLATSHNNILCNNSISGNTNYGLYLNNARTNRCTNNLFNNTNNAGLGGTIYPGTWNGTRTTGTNIIGGLTLGGNYWAKPDGSGFSQVTADADGDGLCDSPYTLATGNIDDLPLRCPIPSADFSANVTSGRLPFAVAFTDVSTGSRIHLWHWDFGDGTTDPAQNPVHTYTAAGVYDVVLNVSGDGGSSGISRTGFISVFNATPQANFTANSTCGIAPLPVAFTDTSTGDGISSYLWTFGDGGTSTEQHPVHTYTSPGSYRVSMTVTNDGGSDQSNVPDFINATAISSPSMPSANPPAYIRISGGQSATSATLHTGTISPEEVRTFEFGPGAPIRSISLSPLQKINELFITTEQFAVLPQEIPAPEEEVLQYIRIVIDSSPVVGMRSARIVFPVETSWLAAQQLSREEVIFRYYRDGKWNVLDAEIESATDTEILYRAKTSGLPRLFAIVKPSPIRSGTPSPAESVVVSPENMQGGVQMNLEMIFWLVILASYGSTMFSLGYMFSVTRRRSPRRAP